MKITDAELSVLCNLTEKKLREVFGMNGRKVDERERAMHDLSKKFTNGIAFETLITKARSKRTNGNDCNGPFKGAALGRFY